MKSIRTGLILFGEQRQNYIVPVGDGLDSGSRGSAGSTLISGATQAFWAADALGVRLAVEDGFIDWEAECKPPVSVLQQLRDYKPELIEILRGDRCRWCGKMLNWPRPVGVVFGDNTAECHHCADAECERIWRAAKRVTISPDALADPAEAILKDMIK